MKLHGEQNWKAIASVVRTRNYEQCYQRWRKVRKQQTKFFCWLFCVSRPFIASFAVVVASLGVLYNSMREFFCFTPSWSLLFLTLTATAAVARERGGVVCLRLVPVLLGATVVTAPFFYPLFFNTPEYQVVCNGSSIRSRKHWI